MHLDYKKILAFLFPLSGDEKQIESLTPESFIADHSFVQTDIATTLLAFSDPKVRAAIHLTKFHNHTHAKALLAYALVHHVTQFGNQDELYIPIPLSKKRKRERGYNQVEQILSVAQKQQSSLLYDTTILKRQRHTPAQTKLSRKERLENLVDAFAVTTPEKITGMHIVILDDVYTTGATLRAAKAALLPHHPASITCIALAH